MSTLEERQVVISFKVAGYNVSNIDFNYIGDELQKQTSNMLYSHAVVDKFKYEIVKKEKIL